MSVDTSRRAVPFPHLEDRVATARAGHDMCRGGEPLSRPLSSISRTGPVLFFKDLIEKIAAWRNRKIWCKPRVVRVNRKFLGASNAKMLVL